MDKLCADRRLGVGPVGPLEAGLGPPQGTCYPGCLSLKVEDFSKEASCLISGGVRPDGDNDTLGSLPREGPAHSQPPLPGVTAEPPV